MIGQFCFKALGQTQAELHSLKVEKLDVCIRTLFVNSVTFIKHRRLHLQGELQAEETSKS